MALVGRRQKTPKSMSKRVGEDRTKGKVGEVGNKVKSMLSNN